MSSEELERTPRATRVCPTCGAPAQPTDAFCSMCGTRLEASSPASSPYVPVAGDHSSDSGGKIRRRRRRKQWYRRPLMVIPLVLIMVFGSVAGALLYRTYSALEDAHQISTPPPEISGDALGGDKNIAIDTGPAQEAIAQRKQQEVGTEGTDGIGTSTATSPSSTTVGGQSTTTGTGDPPGTQVDDTVIGPPATSTTTATNPEQTAEGTGTTTNASSLSATAPSTPQTNVVKGKGINILLMGVDARPGESIDIGVRSDSLGVLHLDPDTGTCRILAVPRDSRVNMTGYGMTKINHALAVGGIPFEQLVVEDYLGITIDHYALIDFAGITTLVDAVGGIDVDNPSAFDMGGHRFEKGKLHLNGEQALLYSRFRYTSEGDFGRVGKQQQVIRALMDKALSADLVKMVPKMFGVLSGHFRTDLGINDMLSLANNYRDSCTSSSIQTKTIPGDIGNYHDDMMNMQLSFVVSKPEDVRSNVEWLFTGK